MQLSKNNIFIFTVSSFLLGLFLYNLYWDLLTALWWLLAIIVIFLVVYLSSKKYLILIIFISLWYICWTLLGYYHGQDLDNTSKLLAPYTSWEKHDIIYQIKRVHSVEQYSKQYLAQVNSIDQELLEETIYALVDIPYNFDLIPGDVISGNSKLYPFKSSSDFAYREYMASKSIFFKSYLNSFGRVETIAMHPIKQRLYDFRVHFLEIIYKIYPETEAIFLWGILIGARESLPDELKTNFNNSWLTHFIAVSWFNMTILIVFLTYILRYLPVVFRVIAITTAIVWFSMLVWETAPVIRAAIMWLIGYYALVSWRAWESLAIILFTLLLMVVWSPYSLNYDVSLHLSFLAVIWIVYTQGFFKRVFAFLPEFMSIREAFVLTMAALSFTLPIMIFNFGQLSMLSPIANIAVTWTIPLAMLLWFLSVVWYMLAPVIWIFIWYFAWIFLKWDMLMVAFFGTQEYAIIRADFWVLANYFELLYFILLIFLILYFKAPKNTL